MAFKRNRAEAAGNLGADPTRKSLQDGTIVSEFSIAVTDKWKDAQGNQKEKTEWIPCVAFGQPAEFVSEYGRKGDNVIAVGKIETRSWEDKETGQKRYKTEIAIRPGHGEIQLASKQREAANSASDQKGGEARYSGNAPRATAGETTRSPSDRPAQGRGSYQDRRTREPVFA